MIIFSTIGFTLLVYLSFVHIKKRRIRNLIGVLMLIGLIVSVVAMMANF